MAALNHPNIVNILDYGDDDNRFFVVEEFVRGKNVRELIRKQGQLAWEDAVSIAAQVSSALAAIHERMDAVHRDVTSGNILVLNSTRKPVAKLIDFDITKNTHLDSSVSMLTKLNQTIGVPQYMSPEQIRGGKLDGRSDIYSLGIVLFEMLTGEVPFTGKSFRDVAYKQLRNPVPDRRREFGIPDRVWNILLRCLSKERDRRPATARQTEELLKSCQKVDPPPRPVHQPSIDSVKTDTVVTESMEEQSFLEKTRVAISRVFSRLFMRPSTTNPKIKSTSRTASPARACMHEGMPPGSNYCPLCGKGVFFVLEDTRGSFRCPLKSFPFQIGRSENCDLVLSDATVSRQHLVIFKKGIDLYMRDLSEVNPVFLNGIPTREGRIGKGDLISLGRIQFFIRGGNRNISSDSIIEG